MEPSGRNRWQQVANGLANKTAQTSTLRTLGDCGTAEGAFEIVVLGEAAQHDVN
jgi:hypothetical protein